jgi:hypothetical protein
MQYRIAKDSSNLEVTMKRLLETGSEGDILLIEGDNQEDILYLRITPDRKWEYYDPSL